METVFIYHKAKMGNGAQIGLFSEWSAQQLSDALDRMQLCEELVSKRAFNRNEKVHMESKRAFAESVCCYTFEESRSLRRQIYGLSCCLTESDYRFGLSGYPICVTKETHQEIDFEDHLCQMVSLRSLVSSNEMRYRLSVYPDSSHAYLAPAMGRDFLILAYLMLTDECHLKPNYISATLEEGHPAFTDGDIDWTDLALPQDVYAEYLIDHEEEGGG